MKRSCLLFLLTVFSILFSQKKYIIYHHIGSDGSLESIKRHGLLTRNEQIRQKLRPDDTSSMRDVLSDRYDVLYFYPSKPYGTSDNKLVGYEVDQQNTSVYNRELRYEDSANYYKSIVPLLTYLKNKERGKEMMDSSDRPQGFVVAYDPYTSQPFYIHYSDEKHTNLLFFYSGEVIVKRDNIPPEELIFFDNQPK